MSRLGKPLDPSAGVFFRERRDVQTDGTTGWIVEALHPSGQVIGYVEIKFDPPASMHSEMTFVKPAWRRMGIAAAMYAYAQKRFGRKMLPSGDQTDMGKELWRGGHAQQSLFGIGARQGRGEAVATACSIVKRSETCHSAIAPTVGEALAAAAAAVGRRGRRRR